LTSIGPEGRKPTATEMVQKEGQNYDYRRKKWNLFGS
jgi:hypothetical protein